MDLSILNQSKTISGSSGARASYILKVSNFERSQLFPFRPRARAPPPELHQHRLPHCQLGDIGEWLVSKFVQSISSFVAQGVIVIANHIQRPRVSLTFQKNTLLYYNEPKQQTLLFVSTTNQIIKCKTKKCVTYCHRCFSISHSCHLYILIYSSELLRFKICVTCVNKHLQTHARVNNQ